MPADSLERPSSRGDRVVALMTAEQLAIEALRKYADMSNWCHKDKPYSNARPLDWWIINGDGYVTAQRALLEIFKIRRDTWKSLDLSEHKRELLQNGLPRYKRSAQGNFIDTDAAMFLASITGIDPEFCLQWVIETEGAK